MRVTSDGPWKVSLEKRAGSSWVDQKRYPGFSRESHGRRRFVISGRADSAYELARIRSRAASDGLEVTVVPLAFERSANYRKAFLDSNPGPWRCRYCHRKLDIYTMTVDHLVPVAAVRRSGIARRLLSALGATSVNDVENLVPSCARCNSAKGQKTGFWIVRGVVGKCRAWWVLYRALQVAAIVFLTCLVCRIVTIGLHVPAARVLRFIASIF